METYLKKFVTLILTLSLLLGSTLSLSSCSYTLGFFDSVLDKLNDGATDGGDNTDNNGDNLTAQRSTLLSSVAVLASFETNIDKTRTMAGSGVIYKLDKDTGDAYIITNYHVVYYREAKAYKKISQDIEIYLYGLEAEPYAIKAEYVRGSFYYDIAVLKVTGSQLLKEAPVRAAELGDSDDLRVLESVIAVGNAEGEGISATKGSISVASEELTMDGADGYTDITVRVMRIDTPVNEGNSGGGLFDSQGKLVGIVNAKKIGEKVDNIAYAIPINLAVAIVENLIYHENADHKGLCTYTLRVTLSEAERSIEVDENGEIVSKARVVITGIQRNSPLYASVQVGDSITEITVDGKSMPVTALYHINEMMFWARPEGTVTLVIERGGATHTVSATITSGMGTTEKEHN